MGPLLLAPLRSVAPATTAQLASCRKLQDARSRPDGSGPDGSRAPLGLVTRGVVGTRQSAAQPMCMMCSIVDLEPGDERYSWHIPSPDDENWLLACGDCCAAATARAVLGVDQRRLAPLSGFPVTSIQRSEASAGVMRGKVDSLMKLVAALGPAGTELIGAGALGRSGGCCVRRKARLASARTDRDEDSARSMPRAA